MVISPTSVAKIVKRVASTVPTSKTEPSKKTFKDATDTISAVKGTTPTTTSRRKKSSSKSEPVPQPTGTGQSTVFQREDQTITKTTYKGGDKTSEVVQTKDTPKSQRRTTSQHAQMEQSLRRGAMIREAQQEEALEGHTGRIQGVYYTNLTTEEAVANKLAPDTKARKVEKLTQRTQAYTKATKKWEEGKELGSADLFRLQAGPTAKTVAFGTKEQASIKDAVKERETIVEEKQAYEIQKQFSEKAKDVPAYYPTPAEIKKAAAAHAPKKSFLEKTGDVLGKTGEGLYDFAESIGTGGAKLVTTTISGIKRAIDLESGKSAFGKPTIVKRETEDKPRKNNVLAESFNPVGSFISGMNYLGGKVAQSASSYYKSLPTINVKGSNYLTPMVKDKDIQAAVGTFATVGTLSYFGVASTLKVASMGLLAQKGTVEGAKAIRYLRSDKETIKKLKSQEQLISQAYTAALDTTKAQTRKELLTSTTTSDYIGKEGSIDVGKSLGERAGDFGGYVKARTFNAYEAEFSKELLKRGYTGNVEHAYQYAKSERVIKFGGELAALLAAGATTERIGSRKLRDIGKFGGRTKYLAKDVKVSKTFAKESLSLIGKGKDIAAEAKKLSQSRMGLVTQSLRKQKYRGQVFTTISQLGFAEGFTESLATDISRRPESTLHSKLFRATLTGAVVAPFAGFLGAEIAVAKGAKQKTLNRIANVLDITEKPGDIISGVPDMPGKLADRLVGAVVITPAFSASSILFTETATPSVFTTPTGTFSTDGDGPKIKPFTPSVSTNIREQSFTPKKTIVPVPAIALGGSVSSISPTTSFTPISTFEPNIISSSVPTSVVTSVPTSVSTSVTSSVATSVPSSVAVSTAATVTTSVPTTVTTSVPTTVTVPTPKIPWLNFNKGKQAEQGYYAYVKQGGKYVKVTDKALSYNDAVSRGGYVADNSSAATFSVRKSKQKANKSSAPASAFTRSKFRGRIIKGKEVRQPNTFIEKNAHRIDSKGEREGITARGLVAAERARKKKRAISRVSSKVLTGGKTLKLQAKPKMKRNIGTGKLKTTRFKL